MVVAAPLVLWMKPGFRWDPHSLQCIAIVPHPSQSMLAASTALDGSDHWSCSKHERQQACSHCSPILLIAWLEEFLQSSTGHFKLYRQCSRQHCSQHCRHFDWTGRTNNQPCTNSWFGRLQAAGPRLDRDALLDRFQSHTANCQVCSGTLHTIQKVRTALKYSIGSLAVSAAILAAVALSASNSSLQTAAAQQSTQGVFAAGGQLLLSLTKRVVGSGNPGAVMASGAFCVALAVVLLGVRGYLKGMENKFIHGVYPPPRNVKQPHDEAQ